MLTRHSHARGQALLETALFMPLFLLGLFGVMLAAKQGALTEKVQLGIRYGGVISSLEQPYLSYSAYSMYATLDGSPSTNPNKCSGVASSADSDLTVGRATFWQPISGSVTPTCLGGISLVAGQTQNILLEDSYIGLTAQVPADGYLSANALGGSTTETASAAENFIRSPDAGTLLSCTPLGDAVKASLEGQQDNLTPDSPASTPFPVSVPPTPVIVAPAVCKTFAPASPLPVETPPDRKTPPPPCKPGERLGDPCIPPPTQSPS
ncbi:MAG: pilus assembly protein, partial [Candidatus Eremiobacteraeota bacterium]|nr:pilus assembly protein [Candidatus Eremiobacteraeota bacterium]